MGSLLDYALRAHEAGLAVLPPRENGTKRPIGDTWEQWQKVRPDAELLRSWYASERSGLGFVCGRVSGGLEVIDFDESTAFDAYAELAHASGLGPLLDRLMAGYWERTPGGAHLFYRCREIAGSVKLAQRPKRPDEQKDPHDAVKTQIETRGEGGYIIAAPTNGRVHPDGGAYVLISGGVETIPGVTPEERDALHELARALDQMPRTGAAEPHFADVPHQGERPGNAYNRRASWGEVLEPHGWQRVLERDGVVYWRRPGKSYGQSATTNHADSDLFYSFTTSTIFEAQRGYSKFGVYTLLNHAGDFRAAAQALAAAGYGEPRVSGGTEQADAGDQAIDAALAARRWPDPLAVEAYHGLAGDIVRTIAPHSEADPAALLVQVLVAFGNAAGRHAYVPIEADRHYANLFAVLVGRSSKARKGTSWGHVRRLFLAADPMWAERRVDSGLASGEALVWAVRDPVTREEPVKDDQGKATGAYRDVIVDPGERDKRFLVMETEYASVLRVIGRDGSTLSPRVREAWDTGNLSNRSKNNPARATGAHVSILGHITVEELLRYLTVTETGNGYANRHLWICVHRSKLLPRGGRVTADTLDPLGERLSQALACARSMSELSLDDDAWAVWEAVYPKLSAECPGLLGAVISRAEAQVLRLALDYALLDQASVIRRDHLQAALAVWEYAEASARYVFGDALGDPVADELLAELRRRPRGMTRTEIRDHFGRHQAAANIGRALARLLQCSLVRRESDPSTGGRAAERWFAVDGDCDESDRSD